MNTWTRDRSAGRSASPARSMSRSWQRASAAMTGRRTSCATPRTPRKSPSEAAGNPVSMTSTPSTSSWRASRSFSSGVMELPGACSPSRRVVSKMTTSRSIPGFSSDEKRRGLSGSAALGLCCFPDFSDSCYPVARAADSSWEMVPSSRSTSRRLRTTSTLIPGSRVPCQDVATSKLATTYAHEVMAGRRECQPTRPGGTSPPDRVVSRLARLLDARFPAPVTYAANRASSFLGSVAPS